MSGTTSSGDADYVDFGRDPRPRRRRGLTAAVAVGVVLAVVLPLGGFAVLRLLGGGGTQPHDVLPANAVGYLRVDLDPSAAQKIEAVRFLRTFPAFEKYTRITDDGADVREAIFDAALEAAPCDLTFAEDVEPWLGERFGVALTAPSATGGGDPGVVGAVQVTDEAEAAAGLERLRSCDQGGGPSGGWTYLDGYMLVAETRQQAEAYAAAAARTSLGDNDVFRRDMDRLGEPGVASAWFSGDGLYQVSSAAVVGDPGPAGSELDLTRDRVRREIDRGYRSGAVAFRFDSRYVEMATVLDGAAYAEPKVPAVADLRLPETTAVAVAFAGGAEYVDQQWDSLRELAPPGGAKALGLDLPADLQTLLGDSFTLALDGAGLPAGGLLGGDPADYDLGVRVDTDAAAFERVLARFQRSAARNGFPFRLRVRDTDRGVVAATNEDYASVLGLAGSLAETDRFQVAVPGADEAQGVVYVSVDALDDPVLAMLRRSGPGGREAARSLAPMESLGVSGSSHDGYATGSLRLTVGE